MSRAPVLFLSHGAGPAWLLDESNFGSRLKPMNKTSNSAKFMATLPSVVDFSEVKAAIVISAHWEEQDFTVNTREQHSLLYDYGGFPKETYNLKWTPKGSPRIAAKVRSAIEEAGLACKENNSRGLDHGVFIPLMFVWPKADIPIVEVSIRHNMKIGEHIKLGEILAPFRKDGVAIIGSGFTSHKGSERGETPPWATEWGDFIHDMVSNKSYSSGERKAKISSSMTHPSFRRAHPTSDHFIPLPVAMAAAGYQAGDVIYEEMVMGTLLCSNFLFK